MKSFSCFKPRDSFKNWSKELDKRVAFWAQNFNSSFKLLLLGPVGAGKTTILKQMKIIHFEGFSMEERQQKAKEIRANLLESVRELTACITASGHQIDWRDKANQARLDFINGLNLDDQTYDLYAAKIYDYSKKILTDKGVETLFAQSNQLSITHRSQYLLNRVDEIRNVNYVPNNVDILQSRRKTSDIQKLEFQVELPVKSGQNIKQTFCIFDVGGQRGERRKWIQVFDGVSAVMFLIDSSSFDAIDDENGRNKLRETINLFYEVWTTRFLLNSNFVLLFNKQDILREKIERGHKIEDHFPEYKLYKFMSHERPVHSRSGEKLNSLFRSGSGRIGSRNSSTRSSSGCLDTGSSRRSLLSPTNFSSASDQQQSPPESPIVRDKKKTSSLYRFGILRSSSGSNKNSDTSTRRAKSRSLFGTSSQLTPELQQMTSKTTGNQQQKHQQQPLMTNQAQIDQMSQTIGPTTTSTIAQEHQQQQNIKPNESEKKSKSTGANELGKQPTASSQANHLAYLKARSFIRDKFLQITRQVDNDQRKFSSPNLPMYSPKGSRADQPKRKVCYHYTTATDTENVRDLFENLEKMVIKSTMKNFS